MAKPEDISETVEQTGPAPLWAMEYNPDYPACSKCGGLGECGRDICEEPDTTIGELVKESGVIFQAQRG